MYYIIEKYRLIQLNYNEYNSTNFSMFLDVPRISASSSCIQADGTVCFCEVHGNPFPNLTWYLSERPVTNSTCTSIIEERLSDTALRSTVTLSHIPTTEPTLQCVATNTYGNASQQFHLDPLSKCEFPFCDCSVSIQTLFPTLENIKHFSLFLERSFPSLYLKMNCNSYNIHTSVPCVYFRL